MDIAVDFDGTCVKHEYPNVGAEIGAIPVLKDLVAQGHKLILFTMRDGIELTDAILWFKKNNIPLYGKQFNPTQSSWTSSNKCYAQLYIDDMALGCPLTHSKIDRSDRPYVDWVRVNLYLKEKGVLI